MGNGRLTPAEAVSVWARNRRRVVCLLRSIPSPGVRYPHCTAGKLHSGADLPAMGPVGAHGFEHREVGHARGQLEIRGVGHGAAGIVRADGEVFGLGLRGDLLHLHDAADVADVGLRVIGAAQREEALVIPAAVEPLASGDRYATSRRRPPLRLPGYPAEGVPRTNGCQLQSTESRRDRQPCLCLCGLRAMRSDCFSCSPQQRAAARSSRSNPAIPGASGSDRTRSASSGRVHPTGPERAARQSRRRQRPCRLPVCPVRRRSPAAYRVVRPPRRSGRDRVAGPPRR